MLHAAVRARSPSRITTWLRAGLDPSLVNKNGLRADELIKDLSLPSKQLVALDQAFIDHAARPGENGDRAPRKRTMSRSVR